MGRFDALTQLDKKPGEPTKKEVLPSSTTPPVQKTDLPANLQTSKDVSMQASKPVNQQTGLHANLQAGKQVSLQTGKQVMIEKYSSYLPRDYKRELKRIALETDREGYEVLIEAVEQYLEKQRK